jgi:hypothetical protein
VIKIMALLFYSWRVVAVWVRVTVDASPVLQAPFVGYTSMIVERYSKLV